MPITPEQLDRARDVATRFGCADDMRIIEEPFELPAQWILVIIGERKGRIRTFGVDPQGKAAS
jgi:hypothetical protein